MLGAQSLAKAMRPSDPSHAVVNSDPGPRKMKHTLKSKYIDVVSPFLENGVLPEDKYKETLKEIHTAAVKQTIENLGENPILGAIPPATDRSESLLPRNQRRVLAQLRTGHCSLLYTYQSRLKKAPCSLCPECRFRRHTTQHLFDCPAAPTSLSVADLWRKPVETMDFLLTLSAFTSLRPPGPSLPSPPPSPPPLPPPSPRPPDPPAPSDSPPPSESSFFSVSSSSSIRLLYSPPPSPLSDDSSTSPKRFITMDFQENTTFDCHSGAE